MAETLFLVSSIEDVTSMLTENILEENFRKDFKSLCDEIEKVEDFLSVEHCGVAGNVSNLFSRYGMSHKINKLNCRFMNFQRRWLRPPCEGADTNTCVESSRWNATAHILKKQPLSVGMEIDIKKITDLLLQQQGREVIAVVGREGQGKTLLVQTVFNMPSVEERFDHRFWVVVSQKLDVENVLNQMGRPIKLKDISNEKVKQSFADLDGKRCLFVFDDVWDKEVLTELLKRIVWPIKSKHNILITSCNAKVAEGLGYVHTHELNRLSSEDSRKLFFNHASAERPEEELNNLEKCCGLPLAIKAIGASMASGRWLPNDSKASLSCLNQLGAMSGSDSDSVIPALKLSYEVLPDDLKPCFLYFSVFPKNMEIECEYLLHMWIAQGFVSGASLYNIGRFYIEELIGRCLIEVSQVGGDGRVKVCKIHNLLHDLAVRESHTECLLKPGECLLNPKEEVGRSGVQWRGLRTISLIKNNISAIKEAFKCPQLRILLLSQNLSLTSISASFFSNLTYLSVLDLSQTAISSLPRSIGKLKHLKFFNLSRTNISVLPEFLSGLRRLQFLDVSHCSNLTKLHSGISKHKFMVYLNVNNCEALEWLPVGISELCHLQTLKLRGTLFDAHADADAKGLKLRDLRKLTLVQQLALQVKYMAPPSEEGIIQLEKGIFGGMKRMRTLSFTNINTTPYLFSLPEDMEVMERLETVSLTKCVVPKWIFGLQNLMDLELLYENSMGNVYKGLQKIPNLRRLQLSHNDRCVEFPEEFGEATAFPKLEELTVEHFSLLERFPNLQDTTMPLLKYFRLKYCNKLTNTPQGITSLKSLEEVEVLRSGGDFRQLREELKRRNIKLKELRRDQIALDVFLDIDQHWSRLTNACEKLAPVVRDVFSFLSSAVSRVVGSIVSFALKFALWCLWWLCSYAFRLLVFVVFRVVWLIVRFLVILIARFPLRFSLWCFWWFSVYSIVLGCCCFIFLRSCRIVFRGFKYTFG